MRTSLVQPNSSVHLRTERTETYPHAVLRLAEPQPPTTPAAPRLAAPYVGMGQTASRPVTGCPGRLGWDHTAVPQSTDGSSSARNEKNGPSHAATVGKAHHMLSTSTVTHHSAALPRKTYAAVTTMSRRNRERATENTKDKTRREKHHMRRKKVEKKKKKRREKRKPRRQITHPMQLAHSKGQIRATGTRARVDIADHPSPPPSKH